MDYIPQTNELFDDWQGILMDEVTANALAWNIDSGLLSIIGPLRTNWESAWLQAKPPGTRSKAITQLKDDAYNAYVPQLRKLVQQQLKNNANITNEQRVEFGIPVPGTQRSPIPPPNTTPVIELQSLTGARIKIVARQMNSTKRGKPKGVTNVVFRFAVGNENPTESQCNEVFLFSHNPGILQFEIPDVGKVIGGYCYWLTSKNQRGPKSNLATGLILP